MIPNHSRILAMVLSLAAFSLPPERLDNEEFADWRAGRNAVYQLAALTIGTRLAVAEA
jgi:hypothetical protein